MILAVSVFIFLLVELEKAFVMPALANFHLPLIFHHADGEEGEWHFLATSASFHGVSHLKTTHAPASDASKGNFSSRNLAARLQSKRSLGGDSAGGAALEVRALPERASTSWAMRATTP